MSIVVLIQPQHSEECYSKLFSYFDRIEWGEKNGNKNAFKSCIFDVCCLLFCWYWFLSFFFLLFVKWDLFCEYQYINGVRSSTDPGSRMMNVIWSADRNFMSLPFVCDSNDGNLRLINIYQIPLPRIQPCHLRLFSLCLFLFFSLQYRKVKNFHDFLYRTFCIWSLCCY